MDKMEYLTALQNKLRSFGRGNKYSLACCDYASNLLDSNVPVLFDNRHLALVLGIPRLISEDCSIQLMIIVIMK